ncbi:MAG: sarcosine oxidase subunit delta [Bosea sp. (in: a-proteobacteria)]
MLRITCPHCGVRDEIEFRYRGGAGVVRPAADAGAAAFANYVYQRENLRGTHLEWWLHAGGCRQVLKVARDTASHRIINVSLPSGEGQQ